MPIYHNQTNIPETTGIVKHNTIEMDFVRRGLEIIWEKKRGNNVTYVWDSKETVIYYNNGSSVLNPSEFTPSKNDRVFLGWSNSPTSDTVLTSLNMGTDPIRLYAVWSYTYPNSIIGKQDTLLGLGDEPSYSYSEIINDLTTKKILTFDGSKYESIKIASISMDCTPNLNTVGGHGYAILSINNSGIDPLGNNAQRKILRHKYQYNGGEGIVDGWSDGGPAGADDPHNPCYANGRISVQLYSENTNYQHLYAVWVASKQGSVHLYSDITLYGRTIKEVG